MFKHLKTHKKILVSGPPRSGTQIATRMIAHDTGHRFVNEREHGCWRKCRMWDLLKMDEPMAIHCPSQSRWLHEFARQPDALIVFLLRNPGDIMASEHRVGKVQPLRRLTRRHYEDVMPCHGPSCMVRQSYWLVQQRHLIDNKLELQYESLCEHPLWVERPLRETFAVKQTTLPQLDTRHVVVTRLNVGVYGETAVCVRHGRPAPVKGDPDEWTRNRIDLATRFCLASLNGQTIQDFEWLVLFDERTPPSLQERMRYALARPGAVFHAVPPLGEWKLEGCPEVADAIRRHVADTKRPYLLTTRLDTDDMLRDDSLARVRAACRPIEGRQFIDLQNGFFMSADRKRLHRVKQRRFKQGGTPFISLLERVGDGPPLTVHCDRHHLVRRHAPVVTLKRKPAWVHVVHGGNTAAGKFHGKRVRHGLPPGFPAST